jgi:hypothetical protein
VARFAPKVSAWSTSSANFESLMIAFSALTFESLEHNFGEASRISLQKTVENVQTATTAKSLNYLNEPI